LLFLISQWVRMAEASRIQTTPASLEMMQLLHDEHQLIGEMVKAQLALPDNGFLDSKPIAATERRPGVASRTARTATQAAAVRRLWTRSAKRPTAGPCRRQGTRRSWIAATIFCSIRGV
jgi:hypothetical protein